MSGIKRFNSQIVRGISPVGERKVYDANDLSESQVLSPEEKTEDESCDNEDELSCVIGGNSEGCCI